MYYNMKYPQRLYATIKYKYLIWYIPSLVWKIKGENEKNLSIFK